MPESELKVIRELRFQKRINIACVVVKLSLRTTLRLG